mgnify:CR=1 FL=1
MKKSKKVDLNYFLLHQTDLPNKITIIIFVNKKVEEKSVLNKVIPDITKEIGRNWMLKIGSIRELLPRMLISFFNINITIFRN